MQEAIYNLVLYSQRRDLHRAVAEWHEKNELPGERTKNFELLAHHWEAAEEWPRAVEYLEKAGAQALESFANEECVSFYNRSITLDRKYNVGTTEERKGRWQRDMAEAQFRLGNISGALQHGQVALVAMGRPLPRSTVGTVFSLLGQVFLRIVQTWLPSLFKIKEEAERELRITATRLQNRMTEAFIYQEDAMRCLDSGLREINTSEPAGQSPELGRAYAVLTVVLGTVPIHLICRSWQRRAIKAAEFSDNPSAVAYVLSRVAIYDLYLGHWELGIERLQQALEMRNLGASSNGKASRSCWITH